MKDAANTDTAKEMIKGFALLENVEKPIFLDKFKKLLIENGLKVVDEDFNKFLRYLHDENYGKLVYPRGKTLSRFIPYCNLKEIGKGEMVPLAKTNEPRASTGRPKGSKNRRPKATPVGVKPGLTLGKSVIFMISKSDGEMLMLNMEDAEKISEQLKVIKAKLG